MRFRTLAALVAAALLVALPVVAQEQRGSIDGVVKDAQGGAIVGASVVAKSMAGVAVEAVTDATGKYRFPSLAPGRYEVTANLSGFAPAKVQNIDLRLGQQLNIPLTLSPGGLTETVQVVAESPLIAITQSARSTSIRGDEIDKMPKGRDFVSLVTQASGANMEAKSGTNAIMIDGSSGGENRWIIDGAESTDMVHGSQGKTMVTDFVEEVQVKSSGYTAEYGGSTGGVINVLSKSGSNLWRGDVFALLPVRRPGLRPPPDAAAQAVERPRGGVRHVPEGRVQPPRAGLHPQRAARPRQGLVLRRLPPAVPAARPHGHVQVRRLDPDLRPGLPVEPPVRQRDRAARADSSACGPPTT